MTDSSLPWLNCVTTAARGDVLWTVAAQIEREVPVTGEGDVLAAVGRYGAFPSRLGLIAHSNDGVLEVGEWRVGSGTVAALGAALAETRINEVHLLGCVTAASDTDVLSAIEESLSRSAKRTVRAYGTTEPVVGESFGPGGLKHALEEGLLVSATEWRSRRRKVDPDRDLNRWFQGFAQVAVQDLLFASPRDRLARVIGFRSPPFARANDAKYSLRALRSLAPFLREEATLAPWMLARPECEVAFSEEGLRGHVLLGGRVIAFPLRGDELCLYLHVSAGRVAEFKDFLLE